MQKLHAPGAGADGAHRVSTGQAEGMPRPSGSAKPGGETPRSASVEPRAQKPLAMGTVPVGKLFSAGEYSLSVREIRYWVTMRVTYEPGQPIVLASFWVGLSGMIITFFGRMMKSAGGEKDS